MLAGILTADGYDVTACSSTSTATIEIARLKNAVHLVIADPEGEDGEVAKLVRKLHRAQPGLRLLGIPNHLCDPIKGVPAKHQSMLSKPFALSTLLYDVRSLLDAKP